MSDRAPIENLFPSKLRVNLADTKSSFTLEAVFALDSDASALQGQFRQARQERLDNCRQAARERFFASPAWTSVLKLRGKLNELLTIAAAAEAELSRTREQYAQQIAAGDPLTLLETLTQRTNAAETASHAAHTFELELARIEGEAQKGLRSAIYQALLTLENDARQEYAQTVSAIVASVDEKQVLQAAVAEQIVLEMSARDLAPIQYAGIAGVVATQHDHFLALPPRQPAVAGEPAIELAALEGGDGGGNIEHSAAG